MEALMLNHKGEVAECTADNIFLVRGGVLAHAADRRGNSGRHHPRRRHGPGPRRGPRSARSAASRVTTCTLPTKCFLTGTAVEVIAVVKVDSRKIGNGQPGPITPRSEGALPQADARVGSACGAFVSPFAGLGCGQRPSGNPGRCPGLTCSTPTACPVLNSQTPSACRTVRRWMPRLARPVVRRWVPLLACPAVQHHGCSCRPRGLDPSKTRSASCRAQPKPASSAVAISRFQRPARSPIIGLPRADFTRAAPDFL